MALTELEIKNAKAIEKPLKLSDGGGLFLLVQSEVAPFVWTEFPVS